MAEERHPKSAVERPAHGAKVEKTLTLLIQSLLKGLGPRVTPALRAQLKSEGLDVDHPPAALPLEAWLVHRRRLAALAFPEAPADEALRLLGLHFLRGWRTTPTGIATSYVLAALGPRRCLTRLDRAFRTTDPSTHATGELIDENTALVTFEDVHGDPTYWVGVVQGGMELLRREATVSIQRATPPGVILRVTWT